MKRRLVLALAASVGLVANSVSATAAETRLRAAPLTKQDFKKIPSGAAVWFYTGKRTYFHAPMDDSPAFVRVNGRLTKVARRSPSGRDWACQPMVFRDSKTGLTVSIAKSRGRWRLAFKRKGQRATVAGLRCGIGD